MNHPRRESSLISLSLSSHSLSLSFFSSFSLLIPHPVLFTQRTPFLSSFQFLSPLFSLPFAFSPFSFIFSPSVNVIPSLPTHSSFIVSLFVQVCYVRVFTLHLFCSLSLSPLALLFLACSHFRNIAFCYVIIDRMRGREKNEFRFESERKKERKEGSEREKEN